MVVTVQRPFSHTRQVSPICIHLTHTDRPTYTRVCLAPNSIASRILNWFSRFCRAHSDV